MDGKRYLNSEPALHIIHMGENSKEILSPIVYARYGVSLRV